AVSRNGTPAPSACARARVDGKFLARGLQRLRVQGVTYGPFAANSRNEPFPERDRARDDLSRMAAIGINSIRTYHPPPEWLLHEADAQGMTVFIDVPWSKPLCFLESAVARREARQAVAQAARRGRQHPCVLAYSIGNEIPANVVRWSGAR